MTKDSRRKRDVRRTKDNTGRRYTSAARVLAAAWKAPQKTFTLAALLAECSTLPPAPASSYAGDLDWEEVDYLPAAFASQLLHTGVPYGSVLALAGALAEAGRDAPLTVESLSPTNQAVLVSQGRRLELCLSQDRCVDLCTHPHCPGGPLDEGIPPCWKHLPMCTTDDLLRVGDIWAHWRFERLSGEPDQCGGAAVAGNLVKAAVSHGVAEKMIDTLLKNGFEDPEMVVEFRGDDDGAMQWSHAIDRERLRLHKTATEETRRIRNEAKDCAACGARLLAYRYPVEHRPEFCSPACAATAPPPQSTTPLPPIPWRYTVH